MGDCKRPLAIPKQACNNKKQKGTLRGFQGAGSDVFMGAQYFQRSCFFSLKPAKVDLPLAHLVD
ncbi:hypothetical protein PL8927_270272 [Planktothrix serta PCC 8927]|uniref:Uncharacterized protein n=1 Tax=Planktothrix serta PCC 8927 TaxID=671068 RepID=A0A7Z9DYY1_9CYAN|nr:hypothetical protein PL8927_270272 [Planktothrix serta PCC 8927]